MGLGMGLTLPLTLTLTLTLTLARTLARTLALALNLTRRAGGRGDTTDGSGRRRVLHLERRAARRDQRARDWHPYPLEPGRRGL